MRWRVILLLFIGLASPASSQLGLPPVSGVAEQVTDRLGQVVDEAAGLDLRQPIGSALRLAQDRVARLTAFARDHRATVELDDTGQPARRGVVLMLDADQDALDKARQLGFAAKSSDDFGNLGLSATELAVPEGEGLASALTLLRKALPDKIITADQLHFPSGVASDAKTGPACQTSLPSIATPVGVIDSGIAPAVSTIAAKGFASGAPAPSDHGTAVASLLRGAGVMHILSADVYGRDPAGGNALAIVRALDWLAGKNVLVISISLAGPRNPLMERAVAAVAKRGVFLSPKVLWNVSGLRQLCQRDCNSNFKTALASR